MAEPVKFTFDQAFDGGAKTRFDEAIERAEVDSKEKATVAHHSGVAEGREQVLHEIEAASKAALNQIAESAHALFSQQQQLKTELKQEMVQLAYSIAAKLAPALMRAHPLAEVEALIEDCMATAHKEPRLLVRVPETLAEDISDRIENMKTATGFPGDIVLIGEAAFGPNDCRVEWPDGGTERRYVDIQKEIEAAVQRFVISGSDDVTVIDDKQANTLPQQD
ncbi:MAG: hypothetical protein COB37_07780 [Kordiimonadales bacterium]|nr:MAG: hypothetical protein COB37_07780 [Kordiimonadales bacterium]